MLRCYSVLSVAVLLVVVGARKLQLATPRDVGGPRGSDGARDRQTVPTPAECPNYVVGVGPKSRARLENLDGCDLATAVGQVDHELAFGFSPSGVDWRACNLPEYPAEK